VKVNSNFISGIIKKEACKYFRLKVSATIFGFPKC